jgi:hypothetical protein
LIKPNPGQKVKNTNAKSNINNLKIADLRLCSYKENILVVIFFNLICKFAQLKIANIRQTRTFATRKVSLIRKRTLNPSDVALAPGRKNYAAPAPILFSSS